MAKTINEKRPMGINEKIKGLPINLVTVPPMKGKTKAQRPKSQLELLQPGDEYISIKAEITKENERY